ncbi:hypothetical protein M408DRAFT_110873 [Serendipita vermifera MAFF 305830]|uniref:Uncharacterized protein n=1 Tax=Serendipita vermifera MAFF 305830 TaxID=933852 RepID=A0A0C3AMD0_SERVB|nr:hypothetical protein M408DRAFT_110873 [Serendipita vermifera MAFF 305830]
MTCSTRGRQRQTLLTPHHLLAVVLLSVVINFLWTRIVTLRAFMWRVIPMTYLLPSNSEPDWCWRRNSGSWTSDHAAGTMAGQPQYSPDARHDGKVATLFGEYETEESN